MFPSRIFPTIFGSKFRTSIIYFYRVQTADCIVGLQMSMKEVTMPVWELLSDSADFKANSLLHAKVQVRSNKISNQPTGVTGYNGKGPNRWDQIKYCKAYILYFKVQQNTQFEDHKFLNFLQSLFPKTFPIRQEGEEENSFPKPDIPWLLTFGGFGSSILGPSALESQFTPLLACTGTFFLTFSCSRAS